MDYSKPKPERIQVGVRLSEDTVQALDAVCVANHRSRRDIIELLINKAYAEFQADDSTRIHP